MRANAGPQTSDPPVQCVVCGYELAGRDWRICSEVFPHQPAEVMTPGKQHRFRFALLSGTPARRLPRLRRRGGEQSAIEIAAKEFNIAEALHDRIVARRDD